MWVVSRSPTGQVLSPSRSLPKARVEPQIANQTWASLAQLNHHLQIREEKIPFSSWMRRLINITEMGPLNWKKILTLTESEHVHRSVKSLLLIPLTLRKLSSIG